MSKVVMLNTVAVFLVIVTLILPGIMVKAIKVGNANITSNYAKSNEKIWRE